MGREEYRTPDEDVASEFERVCQLFQLALGKPSDRVLFESLMGEANDKGLNWIQGLHYVVEHREAGASVEMLRRPPNASEPASSGRDDLRRAG